MKTNNVMANYKNIYFIGIGGIGMSAIARYYNFKGLSVSGYDKTPSELTHKLEEEGIKIHIRTISPSSRLTLKILWSFILRQFLMTWESSCMCRSTDTRY